MVLLSAERVSVTISPMMAKRNVQVAVRLADADLKLIRKAADTLWPGMPITNSTLLLTLARLKAEEVLHVRRPKN